MEEDNQMVKNPPELFNVLFGLILLMVFFLVGLALYALKSDWELLAAGIILGLVPFITLIIREFIARPPIVQISIDGIQFHNRLGGVKKILWNDVVWLFVSSGKPLTITGKERNVALIKISGRHFPIPLTRGLGNNIKNRFQLATGNYPPLPPPRTLSGQT